MTREELLEKAPDLTQEQLKAILDAHNAEVQKAKKGDEESKAKAKEEAEKVKSIEEEKAELEKRLAELENEKLSAEEKREKEFEALKLKNSELEQRLNTEQIKSYAASKNLVGENVDKILSAFGGNFDMAKSAIDSMTSLLDETGKAAALAKEQEIARMSSNPNGQNGGSGDGDTFARDLVIASAKSSNRANQDIINSYKR